MIAKIICMQTEKELDGALVRAERLQGSVLKSAFEGRLV
jgi:hypothetical protein